MWKKIRLPLLIFLILVAALLFFSLKIDFLAAPIRLVLQKATGEKARVGRVEYRLFNRITLRDVELGDYFRCGDVTVSLDLVRILTAPRHPQGALTRIHFSAPSLAITPSFLSMTKTFTAAKVPRPRSSRLIFSWQDAVLVFGNNRIENLNGQVDSGEVSAGTAAGVSGSHRLAARFQSRVEGTQAAGSAHIRITGPGTAIETTVNFARRAEGTLTTIADISRFSWKRLTADRSVFRLNSSSRGFSFVLDTPGGTCSARGPSAETFTGEAAFRLAPLVASSSGTASADFSFQNGEAHGTLLLTDSSYRGRPLGSLAMSLKGAPGKDWNAEGAMSPAGYDFKAVLSSSMALTVSLEKGKGTGTVKGGLNPVSLDVSFTDWPMDNAPLFSGYFPSLKGSLSIEGFLSPHDTRIQARGDGWEIPRADRRDWSASVYQTNGAWFVKALTADKSFKLDARRFADGKWDIAGAVHRVPLRDVMAWGGQASPVTGTVSADVSYASTGDGQARIDAADVRWPGGRADSALLTFLITPVKTELVSCDIRCPGGSVTGKGIIEGAPDRRRGFVLDLLFNDFPLYGHPAKGSLKFAGTRAAGTTGYTEGNVEGNRLAWGPWTAKSVTIPFMADSSRVELKNFRWDRMARGTIALTLPDHALNGEITVAGIPLGNIANNARGRLSGKLSVSGTRAAPRLSFDYSTDSVTYREVTGTAIGTLLWDKNALSTARSTLSVGKGTVALSGRLWPSLSATADMNDIPLWSARAAGIRNDTLKGSISGIVLARGPLRDPDLSARLTGHDLSAGSLVVDDMHVRVNKKDSDVIIDTFTARSGDAELRILQGSSVNIKNRTFSLRSDWRNINTGPAVVFGALSFSGSWDKGKDRLPVMTGSLTTDNFWINEHHMETAAFKLRYSGKTIAFDPGTGQPLSLTGAVDFDKTGLVSLRDLTFNSKGRTVSARGTVGKDSWDLTLSARGADAETLGEILDLPFSLTGAITADITGRGSLSAPDLNVSLSVADGSIEELPFDSLIIKGAARDDILALQEARLSRKNQYSAVAYGSAPFYLTKDIKKRVLSRPLDLTVRIEQGTLNLLTALTRDIRSGTGKVNAEARLTGTLEHPLANGYVKVSEGTLTGRRYFSRITDMAVDLAWKDTVLNINALSGKIGQGRLNVSGAIEFNGFAPSRYDLSFQTEGRKGIAISVPELPIPSAFLKTQDWDLISNLTRGEPRVKISFSGPAHNPVLAGSVDLEDSRFTYPSVARPRDGESFFDPLWPKMSWDLELRSGKNTWYDNELVSVLIQGGIRLTGRGRKPYVHGNIEAMRGTLNYLGREFKIKQAQLEIVKDRAYLEGEASTDVFDSNIPGQTDTIQMYIDKAEIGKISPRFVSKGDPELPPEQALARATGINPERISSIDQNFLMRQQLIRLVDSTLTTPLARTLLRKSGLVDSFRVQYLSQEPIKPLDPARPTLTELLYGTKYSLEKYLTTQMLFGYSMTFDQLQNKLDLRHELELSYQLNRSLFLRGSYELDTSENPFRQYDRRIILEQQFRFGFPGDKKKT